MRITFERGGRKNEQCLGDGDLAPCRPPERERGFDVHPAGPGISLEIGQRSRRRCVPAPWRRDRRCPGPAPTGRSAVSVLRLDTSPRSRTSRDHRRGATHPRSGPGRAARRGRRGSCRSRRRAGAIGALDPPSCPGVPRRRARRAPRSRRRGHRAARLFPTVDQLLQPEFADRLQHAEARLAGRPVAAAHQALIDERGDPVEHGDGERIRRRSSPSSRLPVFPSRHPRRLRPLRA